MITVQSLNGKWPKVELGDVVEFLDNLRKPVTAKDREPGPYPYYGANGQQDSVSGYLFNEPLVLLAEDGGHFGDDSKTIAFQADGRFWVNNHAHVLRPSSEIDIRFLCRHLEKYDVRPFTSGTTRLKLNKAKAAKIPLALPPLSEQKRIADILDKADAIRRKRQDAISDIDNLADSQFRHYSERFDVLPTSVANLIESEVLLVHKDGNFGGSYPRKHEFGTEGIPFLSAKHVATDGSLVLEDVPHLNEEKARTLPFGWIQGGDVLLAHNATVGPVALYRGEFEEALIGTSLTCYRPNTLKLASEFLFAALRGSHFQAQLKKAMSQTTRNQVPITAQRQLTLHIPDVTIQKEFGQRLSALHRLRCSNLEAAAETENLFNSLVQRAFSGQL